MCNESDLEHFSFVVNIVVNVFVETVPRKYSCVLLDWKRLYVVCMQECGRWWKKAEKFQDCVYSLEYLEQNP